MKSVILLLLILASSIVQAQSKQEKIASFINATDFSAMVESIMNNMSPILNKNGEIPPAAMDSIKVWVMGGQQAMKDSTIAFYDALFTDDEVDELYSFYNSKVGKKYLQNSTNILDHSMRVGRNWGMDNIDALLEKISPILEEIEYEQSYDGLLDTTEVFSKGNPYEFTMPIKATKSVSSPDYGYAIHYDDNDWELSDCSTINEIADVCFISKNQSVYTMTIAEDQQLSLKELKAAAISNMYAGAQKVEILDVQTRSINNTMGLNMRIEAQIDGLDIKYDNHYFSTGWGCLQMITFTLSEDFEANKSLIDDINFGIKILE